MEAPNRYLTEVVLPGGQTRRELRDFADERDPSSGGGRPIKTNAADELDESFIASILAQFGKSTEIIIPASENLAAGDLVNFFTDAGVVKCRKADASALDKAAVGFVRENVVAGETAGVNRVGECPQVIATGAGMTVYLSDTPGKAAAAFSPEWILLQPVGKRTGSATSFDFSYVPETAYNTPL